MSKLTQNVCPSYLIVQYPEPLTELAAVCELLVLGSMKCPFWSVMPISVAPREVRPAVESLGKIGFRRGNAERIDFGHDGQSFIEAVLPKIERLAETIERRKLPVRIEVDGGITPETAPRVTSAGASILVAGTAVFGNPSYAAAIAALRKAAEGGRR